MTETPLTFHLSWWWKVIVALGFMIAAFAMMPMPLRWRIALRVRMYEWAESQGINLEE